MAESRSLMGRLAGATSRDASRGNGFESRPVHVKCPHCNEEIDMGLFGAGPESRSTADVRGAQLEAEIEDLSKQGRGAVTVDALKARAAAIRKARG